MLDFAPAERGISKMRFLSEPAGKCNRAGAGRSVVQHCESARLLLKLLGASRSSEEIEGPANAGFAPERSS